MKEKKKKKKVAITVDNLHITYRGLKKTSIRASWKSFFNKVELFEALKGVSFEVEEGKILGIIGKYHGVDINSVIVKQVSGAESTIFETLQSVASQTYPDVQHIVVDGGSTDRTNEIVSAATHNVTLVSRPPKGIFDAINEGDISLIRFYQDELQIHESYGNV